MTLQRPTSWTYELVLRENPGKIGGWLWRVDRTQHWPAESEANAGGSQTTFGPTHWILTKNLAERVGGWWLRKLKRLEAGEEKSWKYQEPVTEDELESRRAKKRPRNPRLWEV